MCELYCNPFDSFVRSVFTLLGNSTPDVQVNVLGASEQANSGERVIWSEIRQAFETMSPTIQTTIFEDGFMLGREGSHGVAGHKKFSKIEIRVFQTIET